MWSNSGRAYAFKINHQKYFIVVLRCKEEDKKERIRRVWDEELKMVGNVMIQWQYGTRENDIIDLY